MAANRPDPFPGVRDRSFPVGPEPGNPAFFGRNVLQGLIDGIEDFVHARQPRWKRRSYREGGPALLGCSPWISDDALIAALERLPSCIVTTKLRRTKRDRQTVKRLRELNELMPGIELRALSGLELLAPKIDGRPQVVGPYSRWGEDVTLSTFRSVGHRTGEGFPIPHAKLAVLGTVCWTDEHPAGGVDDYVWFQPRRLWVSSANFTFGSRKSLEFGYWTEDPALVEGAKDFLVEIIGASEEIDTEIDSPNPDLAEVEFDDVAMAEAAAEMSWDEFVDDDER